MAEAVCKLEGCVYHYCGAHILFCIFSFLTLANKLGWGQEWNQHFWYLALCLELFGAHTGCVISSHHHHLPGKETPLVPWRYEETKARTKGIVRKWKINQTRARERPFKNGKLGCFPRRVPSWKSTYSAVRSNALYAWAEKYMRPLAYSDD